MRQRLGIAGALIRNPRLLLLDEPTTGLDPGGMRDMRALVRRLAGEGMTIMLSSHLLAEVEELCNRVAIIQRGRIVREGSLRDLLAARQGRHRLRTTDDERAMAVCRAEGVDGLRQDAGSILFVGDDAAAAGLSLALGRAGIGIMALVPEAATLEELFFDLTEGDGDVADEAPATPVEAVA
jgi:ABC-2 type transport system ATP-binding protein